MKDRSGSPRERKIDDLLLQQYYRFLPLSVALVIFVSLLNLFRFDLQLPHPLHSGWFAIPLVIGAVTLLYPRGQINGKFPRSREGTRVINSILLSLLGISFCFLYLFFYTALEGIDKQNAAIAFIVIQIVVTFLSSALLAASLSWLGIFSFFSILYNVMDGSPLLSANALMPLLLTLVIYLLTRYIHAFFRRSMDIQILNRERNSWLRMLIEQSPLSIVITDDRANIIQVNRMMEEISGYRAGELIGRNPSVLQSGETDPRLYEDLWSTITGGKTWQGEFINRKKDGAIYVERASISPVVDAAGAIQTYIGIKEDITRQKESRDTILRQNGIIKVLLQDFEEQSESWLWETDGDLRLIYVSDKIGRLFHENILNKSLDVILRELILPDDREGEELIGGFLDALSRGEPFSEKELKIQFEGEVLWLGMKGIPLPALENRMGCRGVGRFITDRKRMEAELYSKANYDEQSGLPNRFLLKKLIARSLSSDFDLFRGILGIVHIRDLSSVRIDFGTLRYDGVIDSLTALIRSSLGEDCTLGRLNENEFLFWTGMDGVFQVEGIHQLAHRLNSPLEVGEETYRFDVNLGIAFYPDDGTTQKNLFQAADLALKRAIDNPQRKVMRYQRNFSLDYQSRMTMLSDFHQALKTEQFVLYYQPQARTDDGRIKGAEALIRWTHPLLGFISPGQFIPLAEKSRFILDLGEWVIYHACEEASRWDEALTLSVNISPIQLQDMARLKFVIRDALSRTGLAPGRLILEITESALLTDIAESEAFILELRELGLKTALDDFGTGYSSLAYLSRLSIDELKIDQSFIRSLEDDRANREVVRTIVELGRTFRFSLIAEGVETAAQREFLRELKCDNIQGYLIGKPVPPDRLFAPPEEEP